MTRGNASHGGMISGYHFGPTSTNSLASLKLMSLYPIDLIPTFFLLLSLPH